MPGLVTRILAIWHLKQKSNLISKSDTLDMQINDLSIMLKALCEADEIDVSSNIRDTQDKPSSVPFTQNRLDDGSETLLELKVGDRE